MNKIKSIVTIFMAVMLMSMTASAYVPPELRTGTYMTELEVIKIALTEHDNGKDTPWVLRTLAEASAKNTNSGRTYNDYAQLREYVLKVSDQGSINYNWIEPSMNGGWQGPGSN